MLANPNGREGGRPDDHQLRRWYIDRRILRTAVGDSDRVAQSLMELGHGGGTKDDLVLFVDGVTGEHRQRDGGMRLAEEERDVLPIDFCVVVRDPGVARHVPVMRQERKGLRRNIATT